MKTAVAPLAHEMPTSAPHDGVAERSDIYIEKGTPMFMRTVLALFSGGFATFALLYVGLVAAFGTTYSAVQADSPTMSVLLAIEATGGRGLGLAELLDRFTDRVLVHPRLDDLVRGGLARLRDGRYVIAPRGVLFARTFVLFRRLLGFGRGG